MRVQDAKKIPLRELLAKLGCEPVHEKSGDVWYFSPFRPQETKPSFHIRERANAGNAGDLWYDFGVGSGGNIIDFVMRYFDVHDLSSALKQLDNMEGWQRNAAVARTADMRPAPSETLLPTSTTEDSKMQTVKVQPLQHWALLDYVRKRGIDVGVARTFLQEIHYKIRPDQEKPFFALAFPNRTANGSEGYELRSTYFQGVHGQKDLSLLWPKQQEQATAVSIFEGVMDFLSWLTWQEKRQPDTAVIVLNGVGMGERAITLIRESGMMEVRLYLDHDTAGQELTAKFQQELADRQVMDASVLYHGHKDFNAFLQQKRQMHLAL